MNFTNFEIIIVADIVLLFERLTGKNGFRISFDMGKTAIQKRVTCYHCGDSCPDKSIEKGGHYFCCAGCKIVFEILAQKDLYTYYDLGKNPGIRIPTPLFKEKFAYLDNNTIKNKLLDFHDAGISSVTFFVPAIHCSSCIWLLEKLYRLSTAITSSRVNFVKKRVSISFKDSEISLREVVELITSIGYEPQIHLKDIEEKQHSTHLKTLYLKIAIAGFAFGNSMFFSLPDYLDSLNNLSENFSQIFALLNIILSLPVLFYCAADYYISSFKGIKAGLLNIDVPISLGISALVIRSIYEIISGSGAGYFDSFNGLVFFLLLGRLFQEKTYASLSFERDYKSYFPVSVTVVEGRRENIKPISELLIGDIVLIRNQELIPADAMLLSEKASIDYSFVTGESLAVVKKENDSLFAGGRLSGASVKIQITKKVSQSYLTKLWNNDVFKKIETNPLSELSNRVAKYFTISILTVAFLAGLYWLNSGISAAFNVISAILIVACPCALALSIPFTFGNTLRVFGRNKFYIKNIQTIERFRGITQIIFDKTGTLTMARKPRITFTGRLDKKNSALIKSLVKNSVHPLSRLVYNYLPECEIFKVDDFVEIANKGILGTINEKRLMIGSADWVGAEKEAEQQVSAVYVSVNGSVLGSFKIKNNYRAGLQSVLSRLNKHGKILVVSGDNAVEMSFFKALFNKEKIKGEIYFNQSPYDKQNHVLGLQNAGEKTLMIGDGLNDAAALMQSDIGITISEDINTFSPACDAILDAGQFKKLPLFFEFAQLSFYIVVASFFISFLYNIIGLSFAISGALSPLVAAILMPLSSVSVVLFATLVTRLSARRAGL